MFVFHRENGLMRPEERKKRARRGQSRAASTAGSPSTTFAYRRRSARALPAVLDRTCAKNLLSSATSSRFLFVSRFGPFFVHPSRSEWRSFSRDLFSKRTGHSSKMRHSYSYCISLLHLDRNLRYTCVYRLQARGLVPRTIGRRLKRLTRADEQLLEYPSKNFPPFINRLMTLEWIRPVISFENPRNATPRYVNL